MKKTVKTTVKKYDENGRLLEHTETIVEEETQDKYYNPFAMPPNTTPSNPYPFKPYIGDVWNEPNSGGKTYIKTGGEPLKVTYDEQA